MLSMGFGFLELSCLFAFFSSILNNKAFVFPTILPEESRIQQYGMVVASCCWQVSLFGMTLRRCRRWKSFAGNKRQQNVMMTAAPLPRGESARDEKRGGSRDFFSPVENCDVLFLLQLHYHFHEIPMTVVQYKYSTTSRFIKAPPHFAAVKSSQIYCLLELLARIQL